MVKKSLYKKVAKLFLKKRGSDKDLYVVIDYNTFNVVSFPYPTDVTRILESPKDPTPLTDVRHYNKDYGDPFTDLKLDFNHGHNRYSDAASDQIYGYLWERS